jgi:CheY-like chemotaxis protein/two-component sensor histidine kinase
MLSHELRTPLNSIVGWSRLLESRDLPPEKARYALQAILQGAEAETHLVNSLLDLSRITSGKMDLDLKHVDLSQVVRAAADTVRPGADAKKINLDLSLSNSTITIKADKDRLQQIVWNLLSNAVKFTPANGSIRVVVECERSNAQIRITDTGRGIRPEFLPRIFDRFAQDERSSPEGRAGLGLGLAIVRALVEAHNGTIEATSAGEGHGSTFLVRFPLPLRDDVSTETVTELSTRRGTAAIPREMIGGTYVLVVDDDPEARELLATVLTSNGMIVQTVDSVKEALDVMRRKRPDVLLTDLQLPDEDGYSLIQKVRTMENEQHHLRLPAIAVTACATIADRERTTAVGFDGHIAKPFEVAELVRLVASLKSARAIN